MPKLKLIQNKRTDMDFIAPIYIYNTELGKYVTTAGIQGREKYKCLNAHDSATTLLEINNDTKLIIEYKFMPEEKCATYEPLCDKWEFPYKRINGSLKNIIPIKDIVTYASDITIYTTSGKKIFSVSRGMPWDNAVFDFGIKFYNDYFVLVSSSSSYDTIKVEKIIYSYSGKVLSKKRKTIKATDLIKEEIRQEDFEATK
ncbi:MAG: hypothetical protein E7378_00405 [Clostridiales bacterium]|nr:hypothetical protein [Clostridiales bacterium]